MLLPLSLTNDSTSAQRAVQATAPGRYERWFLVGLILTLNSLLYLIQTHLAYNGGGDDNSPLGQLMWTCVYGCATIGLIGEYRRAGYALLRSWPLVLFVVLVVLSATWSTIPDLTAKRAFGFVGTTLVGFYLASRLKLSDFLDLFSIGTGVAGLLSLFAIIFVRRIGVMQEEYAGAWCGIYGQKNILAAAMALGIIAALRGVADSDGRKRRWYWGLLLLCSGLLLGSRSASTMLFVVALSALFVAGLALKAPLGRAVVLSVALVGAGVWIAAAATGFGVNQIFDALGRDSSLTGRTEIWPYALKAILDRPYFGWGYKAFWLDDGPVQKYITTDWLPFHAHNGYLEIAIDVGFIGLGIFLCALVVALVRALRFAVLQRGGSAMWPLLTLLYFVLHNIDEVSFATYNSFYWVVFVSAFLFVIPGMESEGAVVAEQPLSAADFYDQYTALVNSGEHNPKSAENSITPGVEPSTRPH